MIVPSLSAARKWQLQLFSLTSQHGISSEIKNSRMLMDDLIISKEKLERKYYCKEVGH